MIKKYNNTCDSIYRSTLPQCICGRRFSDLHKLGQHHKICKVFKEKEPERHAAMLKRKLEKIDHERPNFLICYLCGNKFGFHSIEIHQKTCREKKERELQETHHTKKHVDLPDAPDLKIPKHDDDAEVIKKYNDVCDSIYRSTLPQCVCGRRFSDLHKLGQHQKICKVFKEREPERPKAKSPRKEKVSPAKSNVVKRESSHSQHQSVPPLKSPPKSSLKSPGGVDAGIAAYQSITLLLPLLNQKQLLRLSESLKTRMRE